MKVYLSQLVGFILLLCLISACVSNTQITTNIDCATLMDGDSTQIPFGAVNAEVKTWVENKYGLDESQMANIEYPEGIDVTDSIYWEIQARDYQADFKEDKFVRLGIFWDELRPSSGRIVECFGSPDFYRARFQQDTGGPILHLTLWYIDEGIVVLGFNPQNVPEANQDFPMNIVYFIKPSNVEDTVARIIPAGGNSGIWNEVISELRHWTDGWNLTIDNEIR